jgi:hypothetical protein
MPISRKEFESAELDPSFLVEEFLRLNSDNAYTVEDIIVELASNRMGLKAEEVREILGTLETEKKVSAKMVRNVVYYIYHKTNGPRRD